MFTHSVYGVHPILSYKTPFVFAFSTTLLIELLLSGMSIKPDPLIPLLWLFPQPFFHISSYLFVMILVPNFWLIFIKLLPPTFPIIFRNGVEGGVFVELLTSKTKSVWIGFLDHCWPPLENMSHHTFLNLRRSLPNSSQCWTDLPLVRLCLHYHPRSTST